jgi:hypothetical protein
MDLPKEPTRSTLACLHHYVDKRRDQVRYITDYESVDLCQRLLRYDPEHKDHTIFKLDDKCINDITRAFARQKALLNCVENAINRGDYAIMEQIVQTKKSEGGFYSSNIEHIISGYFETTKRSTQEFLQKLTSNNLTGTPVGNQAVIPQAPSQQPNNPTGTPVGDQSVTSQLPQEKNESEKHPQQSFLCVQFLHKLILEDNRNWLDKTLNYLRKNYFETLTYLTENKSHNVAAAVSYFNPDHPNHTSDWQLNSQSDFHRLLIHNAFEREEKLLELILYSIKNNETLDIMTLNPAHKDIRHVAHGFFSPLAKAIINGYLKKVSESTHNQLSVIVLENSDQGYTTVKKSQNQPPSTGIPNTGIQEKKPDPVEITDPRSKALPPLPIAKKSKERDTQQEH